MKHKPDFVLYFYVAILVAIIASWIYVVANSRVDDFKPKPDEPIQPINITEIVNYVSCNQTKPVH